MQARLRAYTEAPTQEPPPSPWWLGAPNWPYNKQGNDDEPEKPRGDENENGLPYMDGEYRYWHLRSRLNAIDEEQGKDPWTEDWIPQGSKKNPLPMSDEDYLRTEVQLRRAMSGAVNRLVRNTGSHRYTTIDVRKEEKRLRKAREIAVRRVDQDTPNKS
jgi:hypothetical protein